MPLISKPEPMPVEVISALAEVGEDVDGDELLVGDTVLIDFRVRAPGCSNYRQLTARLKQAAYQIRRDCQRLRRKRRCCAPAPRIRWPSIRQSPRRWRG